MEFCLQSHRVDFDKTIWSHFCDKIWLLSRFCSAKAIRFNLKLSIYLCSWLWRCLVSNGRLYICRSTRVELHIFVTSDVCSSWSKHCVADIYKVIRLILIIYKVIAFVVCYFYWFYHGIQRTLWLKCLLQQYSG